jgi:hypothetical protein
MIDVGPADELLDFFCKRYARRRIWAWKGQRNESAQPGNREMARSVQ